MSVALILLVASFAAQDSPIPTIDARDQKEFTLSVEKIKRLLPPQKRKKFEQAVTIVMVDRLQKQPETSAVDEKAKKVLASFHGQSVEQVIAAAEDVIKRFAKEEVERAAKITLRPVPPLPIIPLKWRTSFACEALLSTGISPQRFRPESLFQFREDSFFPDESEVPPEVLSRKTIEAESSAGTDKLATEIDGKTLKFMTRASVETGDATGASFTILENNVDALFAVNLQQSAISTDLDSFVLNKKTGLAIWTKTRDKWINEEPDTQSHYLKCQ